MTHLNPVQRSVSGAEIERNEDNMFFVSELLKYKNGVKLIYVNRGTPGLKPMHVHTTHF